MKYLILKTTDPAVNLATEEYLFNTIRDEEILMFWQNDASVIIGKNQNAEAEVNGALAKALGIPVVRRMTGGGAVYHDLGNLNFSYMGPADQGEDPYVFMLELLVQVLQEYGITAKYNGRNDLMVYVPADESTYKVSGSAYRIRDDRMLHHGTLLIACDLKRMSDILTPDVAKLQRNGVKSVESRVKNLSELSNQISIQGIIEKMVDIYPAKEKNILSEDMIDWEQVRQLVTEKYNT